MCHDDTRVLDYFKYLFRVVEVVVGAFDLDGLEFAALCPFAELCVGEFDAVVFPHVFDEVACFSWVSDLKHGVLVLRVLVVGVEPVDFVAGFLDAVADGPVLFGCFRGLC